VHLSSDCNSIVRLLLMHHVIYPGITGLLHSAVGGGAMRKWSQSFGPWFLAAVFGALTALLPHSEAQAADVICYNCPPQWADFATMLKEIKADLGYDIPFDNKNSGQAMSQVIAEKANPVADVVYWGVNFGMKAKAAGDLIEPYKPKLSEQVPAGLKDPDGYWTTIHSGTLGLFVNKDALGRAPVPACWKDLLKPQYKGMVGYLDPSSAAVG
jgi:putative spermidine/putrescine transport system substrate-binding protein